MDEAPDHVGWLTEQEVVEDGSVVQRWTGPVWRNPSAQTDPAPSGDSDRPTPERRQPSLRPTTARTADHDPAFSA
jgi:hypothetical protein